MARPRTFRPEDIPIPEDAQPHASWPPVMLEMAAHVGAHATLLIVDAFAGQDVYIPMNAEKNPFAGIVGTDKAAILSHVYGAERLPIPTGRNALLRARRQGVIAACRAGRMTVSEGAAIMRANRRHFSTLVNQSNEGFDCAAIKLPDRMRDPRQLDWIDEI